MIISYGNENGKFDYERFAVAAGRMAEAVHGIVDIAVEGWPVMMQGNHVIHIEKRHGENGVQDKSMSNPEDFARIAFALRNFDAIARLPDNPSYRTRTNAAAAQLEFRTRIDGTSVISTVVPDTSRKWMLITSARIEKRKSGRALIGFPQVDTHPICLYCSKTTEQKSIGRQSRSGFGSVRYHFFHPSSVVRGREKRGS